jgi:hypothetical protein
MFIATLYGLKQAHVWFHHFVSVVTFVGFSTVDHDNALFVHNLPWMNSLSTSSW